MEFTTVDRGKKEWSVGCRLLRRGCSTGCAIVARAVVFFFFFCVFC
jgi:hypothetical protein